MTCTHIAGPAMWTKSTWEVRARALVSDLATTVTTVCVPFTNTLVLVTDTTSTWVGQTGAIWGQDRLTVVAIMSGAGITFTAAFAMKTENMSAVLATVVG